MLVRLVVAGGLPRAKTTNSKVVKIADKNLAKASSRPAKKLSCGSVDICYEINQVKPLLSKFMALESRFI